MLVMFLEASVWVASSAMRQVCPASVPHHTYDFAFARAVCNEGSFYSGCKFASDSSYELVQDNPPQMSH